MTKSKRAIEREKTRSDIAGRLKKIRKHCGCTPDQMARFMGISPVTYDANEKGRHVPTIFSLISLDNRLGISIDWLLLGREPMSWKEEQEKRRAAEERERREQADREKRASELQQKLQEQQQELKAEQEEKDVFSREVEEMIDTMKRVPLLRHSVMGYYQRFKLKNEELIAKHLEINKQVSENEL